MTILPAAYQPEAVNTAAPLVVLEGVSGIGKSTLARLLAIRMRGTTLHTLTEPHVTWVRDANAYLRPLPQFAFYLSGVLQASDKIRKAWHDGPVIADRYVSSVVAYHSTMHDVEIHDVRRMMEPFVSYLETPTVTIYLRCSESVLRARMEGKADLTKDDTDLFSVPGLLARLLENFETVAASDPTAIVVETDGTTPGDLADTITKHLSRLPA